MKLSGIDLAWNSEQNTSAIAIGELSERNLSLMTLHPAVLGLDTLISIIEKENGIVGVAIDAPLIIHNRSGQRECEKRLNKDYRARLASCHPANLSLYPDASSVRLSRALVRRGYEHLNEPDRGRWQIECYPHPAIIEIFGLRERLLYKKGGVEQKRQGQIRLAEKIKALADSGVMRLVIAPALEGFLKKDTILSLRGHRLKQNEDALDSVVCPYVCSLYAKSIEASSCYGSPKDGYIYVPQLRCI